MSLRSILWLWEKQSTSGFNEACQAAKLGLRVGILGRVGDDEFGRLILRRLQESGVDTQFVRVDSALKTGLGVALCTDNDRAILTYLGSLNAVYPADITDEILSLTAHVHHGSYFLHTNLRPAMADIFQRALALGATTSLDTNWDPDKSWNSGLHDLLRLTDVFLPNEQEARLISGSASLAEALREFNKMSIHVTAVKRGREGAVLASGKQQFTQTLSAVSGGDSIGAGDSFDAGFLAGWLRGLPLEECLAIASHCGRAVASQIGGLRGQPDWDMVTRLANVY